MKILVLGAKGLLGSDVVKEFSDHEVTAWDREELDVTDENSVLRKITKLKPNVVINCAGLTDLGICENDVNAAYEVNGFAAGYIAKACKECGAMMIYISTSHVFEGRTDTGNSEEDAKMAVNVYGKSKAIGEDQVRNNMDEYRIVRTSWLFGKNGDNFVNNILDMSSRKKKINVIDDLYSRPTYTKDLAKALKEIIEKPAGIYHATNSYNCSLFEFAKEIVRMSGSECEVEPWGFDDYEDLMKGENPKTKVAKRPVHGYLLNDKITPLRGWKEALNDFLIESGRLKNE